MKDFTENGLSNKRALVATLVEIAGPGPLGVAGTAAGGDRLTHCGCPFCYKSIGAALLPDRHDGVHGFLQFPGPASLHFGAQQLQGAPHPAIMHTLPCQQP